MSPQKGRPNDNANDNAPLLPVAHVGPLLRTLLNLNQWGRLTSDAASVNKSLQLDVGRGTSQSSSVGKLVEITTIIYIQCICLY